MRLLSKAILKAHLEDRTEMPLTWDRIKASVATYHASRTVFQAIIFELPPCRAAAYDTRKRLTSMVSPLGMVIPLNSAPIVRDLAFFPREIDRELVIHRLAKSLGVMRLRSFEANSFEHTLTLLEPFIT